MYPPEHFREALDLMTIEELCNAINVTKQTLAKWRVLGQGPRYVRLGKSVFYRYWDVRNWIDQSVHEPGRLPHNTNEKDPDDQVDLEELIEKAEAEGRDICEYCRMDMLQCTCPLPMAETERTTEPLDEVTPEVTNESHTYVEPEVR